MSSQSGPNGEEGHPWVYQESPEQPNSDVPAWWAALCLITAACSLFVLDWAPHVFWIGWEPMGLVMVMVVLTPVAIKIDRWWGDG